MNDTPKVPKRANAPMSATDILIIRDKLRKFLPYDEAEALRKSLNDTARHNYIPNYSSDEYLLFMNNHECAFNICHPQSENHPWYLCLFTVKSQHVYGDCVEECLDNAINA